MSHDDNRCVRTIVNKDRGVNVIYGVVYKGPYIACLDWALCTQHRIGTCLFYRVVRTRWR